MRVCLHEFLCELAFTSAATQFFNKSLDWPSKCQVWVEKANSGIDIEIIEYYRLRLLQEISFFIVDLDMI